MKINVKLLEELFDKKLLSIIKFFLLHKKKEFFLQEIAKETKVPLATVFRNMNKLLALQLVEEVKIKKFKLYRCAENDNIVFLESFLKEGKHIIENFAEAVSSISGIKEILLHGQEEEDRANILIIGSMVDSNEVKRICAEFKEKYDYNVTPLTLEREQYEQMSRMGLYSGKKKILFKR